MQSVIIIIHLMIVLTMVGLILLQKSEGGGLGMGSGGGGGFLSTRGTTNVLTRTTAILAAAFFATSLILSIFAGMDRKPRSVLTPGAPSPSAPVTPSTPLGGPGGGVLDQLRGGTPQQPAPAAPSGPQVPRSQ
jgi:preprotein translocase subunit SecG